MKFGFGDDGESVPTCDPDWASMDPGLLDSSAISPAEETLREARLEGVAGILRKLTTRATLRHIGACAVLVAYLAKVGEENKRPQFLCLARARQPNRKTTIPATANPATIVFISGTSEMK